MTNAIFVKRNRRGRKGNGATASLWSEAKIALVTAIESYPTLYFVIEQHLDQSAANGEVYPDTCDWQFQLV